MGISEFTFKLILLFYPGILCAGIFCHLTSNRKIRVFVFLLQAYILGLTCYFIYWLVLVIVNELPFNFEIEFYFVNSLTNSQSPSFCFSEIVTVSFISVFLGILITYLVQHKIVIKLANKFNVSNKFGDPDVWSYFFNLDEVDWITVRDYKTDIIYDGWAQAFSEDTDPIELFLRDVSLYDNSSGKRIYQVGAVYLSRRKEDISIEFRKVPINDRFRWPKKKEDCYG